MKDLSAYAAATIENRQVKLLLFLAAVIGLTVLLRSSFLVFGGSSFCSIGFGAVTFSASC